MAKKQSKNAIALQEEFLLELQRINCFPPILFVRDVRGQNFFEVVDGWKVSIWWFPKDLDKTERRRFLLEIVKDIAARYEASKDRV